MTNTGTSDDVIDGRNAVKTVNEAPHVIATIMIVVITIVFVAFNYKNYEMLSAYGQLFGSVATVITFIFVLRQIVIGQNQMTIQYLDHQRDKKAFDSQMSVNALTALSWLDTYYTEQLAAIARSIVMMAIEFSQDEKTLVSSRPIYLLECLDTRLDVHQGIERCLEGAGAHIIMHSIRDFKDEYEDYLKFRAIVISSSPEWFPQKRGGIILRAYNSLKEYQIN